MRRYWHLWLIGAGLTFVIDESLFFAGVVGTPWLSITLILVGSFLVGASIGSLIRLEIRRREDQRPQTAMLRSLLDMGMLRARMKLADGELVTIEPAFRIRANGDVHAMFLLQGSDEEAEVPEDATIEFGRQAPDGSIDSVIEMDPRKLMGRMVEGDET